MLVLCAMIFARFEHVSGKTIREAWALMFPHPCEPAPSPPQCAAVGLYVVENKPWHRTWASEIVKPVEDDAP